MTMKNEQRVVAIYPWDDVCVVSLFFVYRPSEKVSGTGDLLARSEGRKQLPDKNLDFQVCILLTMTNKKIKLMHRPFFTIGEPFSLKNRVVANTVPTELALLCGNGEAHFQLLQWKDNLPTPDSGYLRVHPPVLPTL